MLEDICDIALSIHFPKTQSKPSSDLPAFLPQDNQNFQKFKCFKCYGTRTKDCRECSDTQLIQSNHPLAKLLNSLLSKKLFLKREINHKDRQYKQVSPIKQQQDTDQKKFTCTYCQSSFEQISFQCSICPSLSICETCYKIKNKHQHQILQKNQCSTPKTQLNLYDSSKSIYSLSKTQQNCQPTCRRSMEKDVNFWVHDCCSHGKTSTHSNSNIVEKVIDYNNVGQYFVDALSQQFQIEDQLTELDQDELDINSNLCGQDKKQPQFIQSNSQKDKHVQSSEHEQQSPVILFNNSYQFPKTDEIVTKMEFDFNQNLASSYLYTANKDTQRMLCPPKVLYQERFSYNHSQTSRSSYRQNKSKAESCQFSFTGYRCDVCETEPIKKVRYHCTTCEDFDVCQSCFEMCLKTHEHKFFDKVDHEEMKMKVMNKIFGNRNLSLKTSADGGNLFKSWRTERLSGII